MPTDITWLYIIKLVACSSAAFIFFWAYGQITGKISAVLSGIAGGFVGFLAAGELLALPFILLHAPFAWFFVAFCVLNCLVFAIGLWLTLKHHVIFRRRRLAKTTNLEFKIRLTNRPRPTHLIWPFLILALAAATTSLALTQFNAHYDADDSFYVSSVEQNKSSQHLYVYDPSSGNHGLAYPKVYKFEGWEMFEASLSRIFQLSTLETVHGLVPFLVIPLVFVAFRKIYNDLLEDRRLTYLALSLLFLMLIFGGYSIYSQGTFLLGRTWQGKAILAGLIMPLQLFALYKCYVAPRSWKPFFAVLVINIAAVSLNPASVYLCTAAIGAFSLITLIRWRSLWPPLKLVVALAPVIGAGLAVMNVSDGGNDGGFEVGRTASFHSYLTQFVGSSWYFYAALAGIIALVRSRLAWRSAALFYFLPVALIVLVLNPFISPFLINNVTSNTYWRLFWLMPLMIVLPVIGARLFGWTADLTARMNWSIKLVLSLFVLAILGIFFVLGGHYVFDASRPLNKVDTTRQKLPEGVAAATCFLSNLPSANVLAADEPASYLHNVTTKHVLVASRSLNLKVYFSENSDEYKDRRALQSLVNNVGTKGFPLYRFDRLLGKYDVKYVVFASDNQFMKDFSWQYGLPIIYKNSEYGVLRVSR